MSADYDVVIVGAGAVGATLAAAIADSMLKIALVEAREPEPFDAGAPLDLRVFAISRASERILRKLGAWDAIAAANRICTYRGMQVWDAAGGGRIEFDAADVGEPDLGHIIENCLLQSALLDRVAAFSNVTTLWPRACTGLAANRDYMSVKFDDGGELRARLVVAADGVGSRLRQWAGIEAPSHSYNQRAVVSHLTTERHHDDIARQAFLDNGVLALLPLADGRSSLIWSTDNSDAEELLGLDDAGFNHAVSKASDYTLGAVTANDRRASFPLVRMHAERYVRPRFALVGDAAHSVHPLAGQGVNLGLLDAAALAGTLTAAAANGRDVGALSILRRYERARRADNAAMVWSLDGFQKLFGAAEPIRALGGWGLSLVNQLPPVKNAFIRRALGIEGDLPALARASAGKW
ncbi:MAG TPA: UbiH/UbiF/VisC/COQ6 family ubiquinone biosynthesis hydroxylase [Gammaproteobacteria bacterium]|nr:UbiH/UbiF/VisC/COQ6 family ubiquinone biosynthesis hydroxylase [Gammaproteobacteria bacterium]